MAWLGTASEEETFTKALGRRYWGEEGPVRRGDGYTNTKTADSSRGQTTSTEKTFVEADLRGHKPLCKDNLLLSQLLMAMHHITALTKSGNWFQLQSLAVFRLFPDATGCSQV